MPNSDRLSKEELSRFATMPFVALRRLPQSQRSRLLRLIEVLRYEPGEVLYEVGALPPGLAFIVEGMVRRERVVTRRLARPSQLLGPGRTVGEEALVGGGPIAARAVAEGPLRIALLRPEKLADDEVREEAALLRAAARSLVELPLHEATCVEAMRGRSRLAKLPGRALLELLDHAELHEVTAGSTVAPDRGLAVHAHLPRRGNEGLYVLLAGLLEVALLQHGVEQTVARLIPGDLFGDEEAYLDWPAERILRAGRDSRFVFVPLAAFAANRGQSVGLRRALRRGAP